jgi:F420-nonreducing hydrogenase I cytochrome b subunit
MDRRVRVLRHNLPTRIVHWALFAEGATLLLSGFQLTGIFFMGLPDFAYVLHVSAGLIFIGTTFAFVYTVAISHEYKWFSVRRLPYSAWYNTRDALAWLKLLPASSEPIRYDPVKGEYVEKLVPSVIVVWWGYILMGFILAGTGLVEVFPGTFQFTYWIADPVGKALTGVGGLPFIMAIHRLAAYLLLATVTSHAYAAVIYRLLTSIVRGTRDELIVGP